MVRLIKRYDSRKLYDTEESRYVSLEEISEWVRKGQEVQVLDNTTSADVTAQTLTQIILEEGRNGASLPSELLHDLVRLGEKAMSTSVERVQQGVDRLVRKSIDRFAPVRRAREEVAELRTRLEELEASLGSLESDRSLRHSRGVVRRTARRPMTTATSSRPRRRKKGEQP